MLLNHFGTYTVRLKIQLNNVHYFYNLLFYLNLVFFLDVPRLMYAKIKYVNVLQKSIITSLIIYSPQWCNVFFSIVNMDLK